VDGRFYAGDAGRDPVQVILALRHAGQRADWYRRTDAGHDHDRRRVVAANIDAAGGGQRRARSVPGEFLAQHLWRGCRFPYCGRRTGLHPPEKRLESTREPFKRHTKWSTSGELIGSRKQFTLVWSVARADARSPAHAQTTPPAPTRLSGAPQRVWRVHCAIRPYSCTTRGDLAQVEGATGNMPENILPQFFPSSLRDS
jgi:hypothetical protein